MSYDKHQLTKMRKQFETSFVNDHPARHHGEVSIEFDETFAVRQCLMIICQMLEYDTGDMNWLYDNLPLNDPNVIQMDMQQIHLEILNSLDQLIDRVNTES